jgi:hypothetical protein
MKASPRSAKKRLIRPFYLFVPILTLACISTFAARRTEDRSHASHVVIGSVKKVHVEKEKGFLNYVVEIAVEKVEKGDGLKPGDTFQVRCYLKDPDWLKGETLTEKERREDGLRRDSSYQGVPEEGKQIRVYAKKSGDKYDGIYPNWYDVIKRI